MSKASAYILNPEKMCIRDRYIDDRYVDEHTDNRSERLRRMNAFRMEEPMPCEASELCIRDREMTPFRESELCNGCLRPQPFWMWRGICIESGRFERLHRCPTR